MKTNDKTTKAVSEKKDERGEARAVAGKSGSLFAGLPAAVRARLTRLSAAELRTVNVEMVVLATVVRAALPALATLRAAIEAEFRTFDIEGFDMLEEIALAAIEVQAGWQALGDALPALPALGAEGEALRGALLEDVASHVRRGHIAREVIDGLAMTKSYRAIAMDLRTLAKALLAAWPSLQGRTAIEYATIERAATLGAEMLTAVAKRDERDADWVARADERTRMFSLLLNTYEQAQRAVAYLRFREQDADEFAPSPYVRRARRGAGKSIEGSDDENTEGGGVTPADPKGAAPVTNRGPVPEKGASNDEPRAKG